MSLSEAFENIFSLLPSLAGQNYSAGGAPEELADNYETIRSAYEDVAKVMGSAPAASTRGFTPLESMRTKATNGPLEFDHNVANPVHSHAPWIVIKYKEVFDQSSSDVYPVLLFDSKVYNVPDTDRVWLGLGMGVDDTDGSVTSHQEVLSNFKTASEDSMQGWDYGIPTQRGHERLNKFLDNFICWKCYSDEFPSEATLAEDVNKLVDEYLKFLSSGGKALINSQESFSIETTVEPSNPWSWADDERMIIQVLSLLLMESWIEKTRDGDYVFEEGMGYTNIAQNPDYIIKKPKSTNLTPGSWKIYVNSNGGTGRDKSEKFQTVVTIAAECAREGTYTSENSGSSDRAGIKALVALLPDLFSFESASTINFIPSEAPGSEDNSSMSKEENELIELLNETNNVVLEGVPGTGKTYFARKIAGEMGDNTRGHCNGKFAITMHPSTSYEDFVEGLRPNKGFDPRTYHSPIHLLLPHPIDSSLRVLAQYGAEAAPQLQVVSVECDNLNDPQKELSLTDVEEQETDTDPAVPLPELFTDTEEAVIEAGSAAITEAEEAVVEVRPAEITEAEEVVVEVEDAGVEIETNSVESATSSSSLDDFITDTYYFEQIVPPESAQFITEDGFFLRVCIDALQHPDDDIYILVDEINRANVPKVLGDLLSTMEDSKRIPRSDAIYGGDSMKLWRLDLDPLTITLPYSKRVFFVPQNIKIIATRNTTDRSVVPLDAALRRRFAFLRLEPQRPNLTSEDLTVYLEVVFGEHKLNAFLVKEIGLDGLIGHSYFYDMGRSDNPELIWKYNVLPQLIDVLDGANYMEPNKIDEINEILMPTNYFLYLSGVGLHQKISAKKITDDA